MPIRATCSACRRGINAPDKYAGKSANCPGCGSAVSFPLMAATPTPVPPPPPQGPPAPPPISQVQEPPPVVAANAVGEAVLRTRAKYEALQLRSGFHARRFSLLAASCIGGLGTFLPWVKAPIIGTVAGTQGPDGWISLGLFAVVATLAYRGESRNEMTHGAKLGSAIIGGIAGAIAIWKIVGFNLKMSDMPSGNPFAEAMAMSSGVCVGLYVIAVAGVATALLGLKSKW
jgi:hypothetical protein